MRIDTVVSRNEVNTVLYLGLLYVVLVAFRAPIIGVSLGFVRHFNGYHEDQALLIETCNVLIRLPAFLGMLILISKSQPGALHDALHSTRRRALGMSIAITSLVTIILNATDLWPFAWRFPSSSFLAYLGILLTRHQWLTLVLFGVWSVLMVPIIEEIVFRYGVLQWLFRLKKSVTFAVVLSSLLFAVLHLGPGEIWHPALGTVIKTVWLFAFSIVLSSMCIRRLDRLAACIMVHVTYNALVFGAAIVSLTIPV